MRGGIRARLWTAFISVAAVAVSAAVIASISYNATLDAVDRITERRLPVIAALTEMRAQLDALVAIAPNAVLTVREDELTLMWGRVRAAESGLNQSVNQVRAASSDQAVVEEISLDAARVSAHLVTMLSALIARTDTVERTGTILRRIDALEESRRLQTAVGVDAAARQQLEVVADAVDQLRQMFAAVALVGSEVELAGLEFRIGRQLDHIGGLAQTLPPSASAQVADNVTRKRDLAFGERGLFPVRERDQLALRIARDRLGDVQTIAERLTDAAETLVAEAQAAVEAERARAADIAGLVQTVLVALSVVAVLTVIGFMWFYVGKRIVGRIDRLNRAMRSIADGNLQAQIPGGGRDEIEDMAQSLVVFRDAMIEQRRVSEKIQYLNTHDPLTDLPNRLEFERQLALAMDDKQSHGAMLYLSLGSVKDVTETFGHMVGDAVIQSVAEILEDNVRPSDLVARLGGDDFGVLIRDVTDQGDLTRRAEDLANQFLKPFDFDGLMIDVSPVIGVAQYPADATRPSKLIENAESAMQFATASGRQGVSLYAREMQVVVENRKLVRRDLRRGIAEGQFHLAYQPKIDLSNGEITGMEALIRWDHPGRGRISPAMFIPEAETSGLILQLGHWVLHEACQQTKRWQDQGIWPLTVAVNVSPLQFLRQDLAVVVEQVLNETGLSPEYLELEITEGVLVRHEDRVMSRMRDLRTLGVRMVIDDFGTGYSSLSYLRNLPVDELKIDQSFVRHLDVREEDARICRAIVGLAHDFGLSVVAEGIETSSHADFLAEQNCDMGQGYYFAKPVSSGDFENLFSSEPHWRRQPDAAAPASPTEGAAYG